MNIKVFVSSVFHGLGSDRRAIRETLAKLEEMFVGMEYFGTDRQKPADYCIHKVKECDVFVGLIGNRYGSADKQRELSFTEIEYDAALESKKPCLLYFKCTPSKARPDARQEAFKAKLSRRHVVADYRDLEELRIQFLVDFIKLLKGPLFIKIVLTEKPQIPINGFRVFCEGFLEEQIKVVAQDKYLPGLYVERQIEGKIAEFTDVDERDRIRFQDIFAALKQISSINALNISNRKLTDIKKKLLSVEDSESGLALVDELKRVFFFEQSEAVLDQLDIVLSSLQDPKWRKHDFLKLVDRLRNLPGTTKKELKETRDILTELTSDVAATNVRLDRYAPAVKPLLNILPGCVDGKGQLILANDLLRELSELIQIQSKRCLAIIGGAGSGKTNVICHQAKRLAKRWPVVLISGQLELEGDQSLDRYIQEQLDSQFEGVFCDWLNRIGPELKATGQWMYVIVDGVNESARPEKLAKLLENFLFRAERRRIKLIIACRDIFWEMFEYRLERFLAQGKSVLLDEFADDEWMRAINGYFNCYGIRGKPKLNARQALRNPLLLRFFCEANQEEEIGAISEIRLLPVFDSYFKRTCREIAYRLNLTSSDPVIAFLVNAGECVWQSRNANLSFDDLGLSSEKAGQSNSIYSQLRSENIIFEEKTGRYGGKKYVRFVYDEFIDYIIARGWLEALGDEKTEDALLNEIAGAAGKFPSVFNALSYLDRMAEMDGRLLSTVAEKLDPKLFSERQYAVLRLFEDMGEKSISAALLNLLDRLEQVADDEIKKRLGPIILKVQAAYPSDNHVEGMVRRMLEIDIKANLPVWQPDNEEVNSPVTQPEAIEKSIVSAGKQSWLQRMKIWWFGDPTEQRTPARRTTPSIYLCLPPARHHYDEETKLNAIALLVSGKDSDVANLMVPAVKKLGRTNLNAALSALRALDGASDQVLFTALPSFLRPKSTEYCLYAAWLLRERYGTTAAANLLELLLDQDARVRRFTMRLFEQRAIELEFVKAILARAMVSNIKPWVLTNLIKLLGRRHKFKSSKTARTFGKNIVAALNGFRAHDSPMVRLEAYRSLMAWTDFFDTDSVLADLRAEQDPYLKDLARVFEALSESNHGSSEPGQASKGTGPTD